MLRSRFCEADVQNRVLLPIPIVVVPPLGFEYSEAFRFHCPARQSLRIFRSTRVLSDRVLSDPLRIQGAIPAPKRDPLGLCYHFDEGQWNGIPVQVRRYAGDTALLVDDDRVHRRHRRHRIHARQPEPSSSARLCSTSSNTTARNSLLDPKTVRIKHSCEDKNRDG